MKMTKTLLVFLHGSGGTGPELRTFLDTIPLEQFGMKTFYNVTKEKNIEYVCPTAVRRPYTPAMGESMNVWFDRGADFARKGINDKEDLPGANGSVNQILSVIDNLKSSYEHIFVGGFSQGGCLSLHMLRSEYMARQPEHLRGIFSMGSFLVKNSTVLKQPRVASDDSRSDLPILMMHGEADCLIRLQWGESTATALLQNDRDVQFKVYPGVEHEIRQDELTDLLSWIDEIRDITRSSNQNGASQGILNGAMSIDGDVENEVEKEVEIEVEKEAEKGGINEIAGKSVEHPSVPYSLSHPIGSTVRREQVHSTVVSFQIPANLISVATARPILACGGSFELRVQDPSSIRSDITTVETHIVSSDPHHTANEIGKRLFIRLGSDGASLRACPMS